VALLTALGDDAAPGTEVTGGSYARQTVTVAASAGGSTANSADLVWTGMPACTLVGWEIWDSAGTPVRLWRGALDETVAVLAGSEYKIAAGGLVRTMS
jgi:hypothetical protein